MSRPDQRENRFVLGGLGALTTKRNPQLNPEPINCERQSTATPEDKKEMPILHAVRVDTHQIIVRRTTKNVRYDRASRLIFLARVPLVTLLQTVVSFLDGVILFLMLHKRFDTNDQSRNKLRFILFSFESEDLSMIEFTSSMKNLLLRTHRKKEQ